MLQIFVEYEKNQIFCDGALLYLESFLDFSLKIDLLRNLLLSHVPLSVWMLWPVGLMKSC